MSAEKTVKPIGKIRNLKQKTKLILILAAEFVAIITVLLLILFAGKKTYTVTFDLDGGILISGDLEQRVTQGQNATPPTAAKYGHYLLRWSGSYRSVTRDVTVKAIWEYETSPGIEYSVPDNTNYCLISGSFKEIQGEVFIGSYYNERQVMGIEAEAFKDRTGITAVYLLDGILAIEEEAFAGCESLEIIDVPSTVVRIGKNAFAGCKNLKEIILPESLKTIEAGAFSDCSSLERAVFPDGLSVIGQEAFIGCESLKEIVLPKSLKTIGTNAFNTSQMTINLYILEEDLPKGFAEGWCPKDAKIIFDYGAIIEGEDETDSEGDKSEDSSGLWGGIL
nr:hypothetical protein [Oscillospiraceae bacterium]